MSANGMTRVVLSALRGQRFPLEDEKACQAAIARVFTEAWSLTNDVTGEVVQFPTWEREVKVAGGVIDFLVGWSQGCGVEIKLKGQPEAIRRQLRGYAADDRIGSLLLVTARPVGLVQTMNGKPVAEFDLSRAWL